MIRLSIKKSENMILDIVEKIERGIIIALLFGLLPEFSLFGFGPEIPRLQELPADSSWLDNVWNVMSYIIFNIIGDIVRLDGSYWDIAKVFVYIFFGTWLYSYILSGIWLQTWFGKKQKA